MSNLDQLINEIRQGQGVATDVLGMGDGFLGRVQDTDLSGAYPANVADPSELLARLYGESFIGGYNTPEQDQALQLLQTAAQNSGNISSGMQDVIARRRSQADSAGTLDPQLLEVQSLLRNEYDNSRTLDPVIDEALGLRRDALAGLSAPELTALQETLTSDANRAYQGALRSGASAGAAAGRRTIDPTLMRDITNDLATKQLQANQETLLADVNVRNQALGDFENLGRYIDTTKFDRAQQTLGSYGDYTTLLDDLAFNRTQQTLGSLQDALLQSEDAAFQRGNTARLGYQGALEANVNANRADRQSRLFNFQEELARQRDFDLNKQLINMNNLASEVSARTGVAFGVPAFLEQKEARQSSDALALRGIELQKALIASQEAIAKAQAESGGGSTDEDLPDTDNPLE